MGLICVPWARLVEVLKPTLSEAQPTTTNPRVVQAAADAKAREKREKEEAAAREKREKEEAAARKAKEAADFESAVQVPVPCPPRLIQDPLDTRLMQSRRRLVSMHAISVCAEECNIYMCGGMQYLYVPRNAISICAGDTYAVWVQCPSPREKDCCGHKSHVSDSFFFQT